MRVRCTAHPISNGISASTCSSCIRAPLVRNGGFCLGVGGMRPGEVATSRVRGGPVCNTAYALCGGVQYWIASYW